MSRSSPNLHPLVAEARRLHTAGQYDAARTALMGARAQIGESFDIALTDALIDLQAGHLPLAARKLAAMARAHPRRFEVRFNQGICARFRGLEAEALKYFERADKLHPGTAAVFQHRADLLTTLGRIGEAAALNRAEHALRPDSAAPLLRLAAMDAKTLSHAEITALERIVNRRDSGHDIAEHFALGDVYWTRDRRRAMQHYLAGNARKVAALDSAPSEDIVIAPRSRKPVRRPLDRAEASEAAMADFVMRFFDADRLAALAGHGVAEATPIFVIGMPRSGTTLTERIIAAHPRVAARGEIGTVGARLVRRQWPYAWTQATADDLPPSAPPDGLGPHLGRLAATYLDALRQGDTRHDRLVDKSLDNFLHVGLIHLLFPNARIVEVRRDPVDNGLACFRKNFRTGLEWTYDLAAIGRRYCRYRAVMAHWQQVLPGRVATLQYEALIADPEPVARQLIADIGLDWDPRCLDFHKSRGPVRTASVTQVRQPIYTTSVDTAGQVADMIAPLLTALGPHAPRRA